MQGRQLVRATIYQLSMVTKATPLEYQETGGCRYYTQVEQWKAIIHRVKRAMQSWQLPTAASSHHASVNMDASFANHMHHKGMPLAATTGCYQCLCEVELLPGMQDL